MIEALLTTVCVLITVNLVVSIVLRRSRKAELKKLDKERIEFLEKVSNPLVQMPTPQVVDLSPLRKDISSLPNKILQSIQGSINNKKGALGELVGLLQLKAEYDKVIPFNITDFICIRYPKGEDKGTIDFIDVKSGPYARLTASQQILQKLIREKRINFIELKVASKS